MSEQTRAARHRPVSACVSLLGIEPLLVRPTDDPLAVMRSAAEHPETRVLGVVGDDGILVGVLSTVRLAEAVVVRVAPEALLADIDDLEAAARFGTSIGARTIADVMLPPAVIRATDPVDEAFRRMHARHLSGLYVVDEQGRPTGYLDLMELTLSFVGALEAEPPATD